MHVITMFELEIVAREMTYRAEAMSRVFRPVRRMREAMRWHCTPAVLVRSEAVPNKAVYAEV